MAQKAPIRTCVACRHTDTKHSLIRFVKHADYSVHVDRSGKTPGRGAYLCAAADCFNMVRHNRRLDRALRTSVSEERWLGLADEFFELCKQQPALQAAPQIDPHENHAREQD